MGKVKDELMGDDMAIHNIVYPVSNVEVIDSVRMCNLCGQEIPDWVSVCCKDIPSECGEHDGTGWPCPTCDICRKSQCSTEHMEWNGATWRHVECEGVGDATADR